MKIKLVNVCAAIKTLSGICVKTNCSFKDESGYRPSIDSSSNPRSGYTDTSSSPNPSSSSSSSPIPRSGYIDPSIDLSPNPKVITRYCNRCNYVKPLSNFEKCHYTCRNCTSTKVSCLYCPSIVRYDGMNAQVKRQHPDVDIPKGFTRNLRRSWGTKTEGPYADLTPIHEQTSSVVNQVVTPILLLHKMKKVVHVNIITLSHFLLIMG